MDSNIRNLLGQAQARGYPDGIEPLQEAFNSMKNVAEKRPAVDTPEPFSQDLYVLCAEQAFIYDLRDMSKDCLKMYFMKTPPTNQFLCRAYLCQASLLAPMSAENPEQLEKAVVYLVKAITMAKDNPRYHFLVYNASVIYWRFSRPFLKPNYKQYLARSLHQVVKALDDIDDKDYEWRAQLMISLIECHMDAGRKADAAGIASAAATFIKQNVPQHYKTVFGLMVRYQLADASRFQKDIKQSAELNVYHRICKLKLGLDTGDFEKEPVEEMRKILNSIAGSDDKYYKESTVTPEERFSDSLLSSNSRTQLLSSSSDISLMSQTKSRDTIESEDWVVACYMDRVDPTLSMPYLLLELARLALEMNIPDVAENSVELIKDASHLVTDSSFFLEVEFLQAELMVKSLRDKQDSYAKAIIEVRLQAIKRSDEAIINAVRLGNPNVIQAGCVTQWNLCLPLLQGNLKHHLRKPLTTVAEALESIESMCIQLRCQVHMELAKCEEDQEQIQVAMDNIKKALLLDDGDVYKERLEVALHRLQLRAELYKQPEKPEDTAAMIIEQARRADSGTMRMKRSLLVKAGQALAPDAFLLVLESENDAKEVPAGKGPLTVIRKLAGKSQQFIKCVRKAEGHLRRLGDDNDRERARLWGDLAKTARKQEVWDVCRVASRFCLLYDDGRWKIELPQKESDTKLQRNKSEKDLNEADDKPLEKQPSELKERSQTTLTKAGKDGGSRPSSPTAGVPLYDKDLIRMMAEINFVNGESLIHLLRSEKVELGDAPVPPVDKSKRPKGYVAKKPEEDPDWLEYCDWIKSLTKDAVDCFMRAVNLGIELRESWVVCSSAAYVWNYYNHVLQNDRHTEIIEPLQTVLDGIKKVGHAGETSLLVNLCNALAIGLITPWLPPPPSPENEDKEEKSRAGSPKKGKGAPAASKSTTALTVPISPDAGPDLKKAVEVCEYAMKITNGEVVGDVVPIAVRHPLLKTWVKAKQMAQSQINKGLGTNDEADMSGQKAMTRAMVGVEMLWLNSNGIMEFRDAPSLQQAYDLIETPEWTDKLVELQLWARLAKLAYKGKDHQIVTMCAAKSVAFAERGTQPRGRKQDPHKYLVEREMLSYATCLYGQSLIDNWQGKNSIRRQAMAQFLSSAGYAKNANNYDLVMVATRHYWNASLPLINQPIEREILKEPLSMLLEYISATTDKSKYKKQEDDEDEDDDVPTPPTGIPAVDPNATEATPPQTADPNKQQQSATGIIGGPDDDLTLRASLYGVLFQSYADKGEWEAGLRAMDQAINDMPRTNHRLLIFKHLVVVKAKLGQNVGMSIQKFKIEMNHYLRDMSEDESEDYVAHMWRRVALCSKEQLEQLQAYQNAIEALNSPSNEWQKFDYLLEFGQWLYCNEFPLEDAIDQFEWAIDILLNMKFEKEEKKEDDSIPVEAKGKKGKKKGAKTPPSSAKKDKKGAAPKSKPGTSLQEKKDAVKDEGKRSPAPSVKSDKSDKEINAEDYVPIKKEAVIGVLPNNTALTVHDLTDMKQLEGLFRAHVLLAQVSGRNNKQHSDHILMAYGYLMRMWEISVGESGPVMKEIAKNPPETGKNTPKGGKDKGKGKEPVKEKPKRKGPLDALPHSTEEWGNYDVPDEVMDAFKHEMMKTNGINENTIAKPTLTFLYLDILNQLMRDIGYNHLSLPVLAMSDLLSRDVLKHRALNALVHLRSMEVCVEMNLIQGAKFHEKLADYRLNEEEQASSREDMAMWKEKQVQVAKEEARIKKSLGMLKKYEDFKGNARDREFQAKLRNFGRVHLDKPVDADSMKDDDEPASIHLGKQIGAVKLRDVWTDTAEVLIRNAIYQPARELLNEAHLASVIDDDSVSGKAREEFEDKELEGRVLLLLAKLSYREGQYGQAVNLAFRAQSTYDGDEMFWYDSVIIMSEATLKDYNLRSKDRTRKSRAILVQALNVFTEVAETRPNKAAITGYILAMLEAKLGSVQLQITMGEHDNLLKPKVASSILSACKKLAHGSEALVRLGYKREALDIMKEHGEILLKMARTTASKPEKHDYFGQALQVMKQSIAVATDTWHNIHTMTTIPDMKTVSTPVQRELAEVSLLGCEVMVEMYTQYMEEERQKQIENMEKGPIVRALEEYIAETPNYTPSEKDWVDMTVQLGECIVVHLNNAHTLAGNIPEIKARSLYNMGKILRLLAQHKCPNSPGQWNLQEMDVLHIKNQLAKTPMDGSLSKVNDTYRSNQSLASKQSEEGAPSEQEPPLPEIDTTSREYIKNSAIITKIQEQLDISENYMSQATECLTQAINLSLNKGHDLQGIAGSAALELVEVFGQYDPAMASQYLAMHQSCEASAYMESVLYKALVDPTYSQVASMLHQRKEMLKNGMTSNALRGPVMTKVLSRLEEGSLAWQRLAVGNHHLDMLKEFPPNFNFVILQHSPDKKHLYGAIMDKPKPGGAGGKGSQKNTSLQAASRAKVVRVDTSKEKLDGLISRWRWFKHSVMQQLLKIEYQRSLFAQREKMLSNLGGGGGEEKQEEKNPIEDEWEEDEVKLHEEFIDLLAAMEDYLRPITSQLDTVLRPPSSTTVSQDKPKGREKEPEPPQEYVVLLADPMLLEMPLEALQALQAESIVSLSRELSLQLLFHKNTVEVLDEVAEKAKKEKEKNKPPSRIPGLRDANKKQSKIIPLDRPVPPTCHPVDTHNFRFIVDPHLDCSETESKKPIEVFDAMMEEHVQQFTPRWLGVMGNEHAPSPGEYEIYMLEGSGFIFYGMERLMCQLPPHKLASLNIPDCLCVMLYDLAQTHNSFSRQSKTDVLKTAEILSLEKPVETAVLLGLSGVKSIFCNQWHCTLQENAEKLDFNMKDLLQKGKTTGQTVRMMFTPYKRRQEEAEEEAKAAEAKENKEGAKDTDKKKEDKDRESKQEGGEGDENKEEEEPEETEEPLVMSRSWYNMVCYGLPNVMVTQLSK